LGGSGQTVVRAINGEVVDLINRAEVSANTGDNQVGGGVGWVPGSGGGSLFAPGYLQVVLRPPEAAAAGAGWRLLGSGQTNYVNDNAASYGLLPATYTVEFRSAAGYVTPTNRPVTVEREQTTTIEVEYRPAVVEAPTLGSVGLVSGGQQFRLEVIGEVGARYAVETKTNLMQANWTVVVTNVAGADGRWVFLDLDVSREWARYYRVRVVE
jgi:hypothetical protein